VSEKILTPDENYAKGFNHQYGFNGHKHDLEEACKYYKLAAEGGRIDAEYSLGEVFEQRRNYTEAFKWHRLAFKGGDKLAVSSYGRVAKILGYEAVVNVLQTMNEITQSIPQPLTMLLPADSLFALKEESKYVCSDNGNNGRIGFTK
jgi:TPR repeat protein